MFTKPFFASLCLITTINLSGCGKPAEEPKPTNPAHNDSAPAQAETYVVRGIVRALPNPADPRTELRIHHEHIPGLLGKDGTVHINNDGTTGMKSMEMPFPLGPDVSLEGIALGDKVEFELTIARVPRTSFSVTRITKLPADTAIDFANKPAPKP